jgi:glutamate carboxypeptidase
MDGMKDLLAYFNRTSPQALDLLERLVNMDSPSTDKTLVDRCVRFIADRFLEIGGNAEVIPNEKFGNHLRVRFSSPPEARAGAKVLLLGHTDTVFASGEAARRPFRVENGRATGPGVFDMKSGIVLMWWALGALIETGGLPRSVTVLLTSDEEVGSHSSRALIESEAGTAEVVLVLEPSLPGGGLKTARKGTGHFTVKALGRAAHAGIEPEKGINAIEEIAHQTIALQRMNVSGSGTTVTAGLIRGGTRANVVPAEAAVEVDVRISSVEEMERITTAIRALKPRLEGARLEVRGGINRPPMERTGDTVRLFEIARGVAAEMNIDLREGSTGGASDANFTSALGVPTLDGLGAIGEGAHSIDEFVDVASLPMRAALAAGLIRRI